jgi:hypothetical protein
MRFYFNIYIYIDTICILYLLHITLYITYNYRIYLIYYVGRDSSVGIATRYGLDGPGVESRLGARFSAPVQTGPGAHPAAYTMGTGSFPGVKRPGRGVDHPHSSSAEVKERVELYVYSPLCAFVACSAVTFTFTFYLSLIYYILMHNVYLLVQMINNKQ